MSRRIAELKENLPPMGAMGARGRTRFPMGGPTALWQKYRDNFGLQSRLGFPHSAVGRVYVVRSRAARARIMALSAQTRVWSA